MVEPSFLLVLIISMPSILLFSYLISSPNRRVLIRNSILFLDLFAVIFLIFLVINIGIPFKFIVESNLFLFQIVLFLILGINLVSYSFFREENYKHFIDFFFSFPLAIIFSVLISTIFIMVSFHSLMNALENTFFSFLIVYANLAGFILLSYYLGKDDSRRVLYLRCIGGILFLLSSFLYISLIPLIAQM